MPDSKTVLDPKAQITRTQQRKEANANLPWEKRRCLPKKEHMQTKREIAIAKFKNIDFSHSDPQLTVQTLEFPDANIKRTEIDTRDECGKRVLPTKTGKDLSTSSQPGFRDGVFTVNMQPRSCTSTSIPGWPATTRKTTQHSTSSNRSEVNSQEMIDSYHVRSLGPKHLKGNQWKKPCEASNVVGAPLPHIGRCPKNYQQLSKLSPMRQKFFLTQDPRKTHCLVNPSALRHKQLTEDQQFKLTNKMVKHGDNVCASTGSESSDTHICEVIDLENPVNLDFQGMDYKNTYEKDEQEQQNQQTYWRVLRYMQRRRTKKHTEHKVEAELHADRLAIPPVFNTKIKDEPIEEALPSKDPKLAELFRSPDKPSNRDKIDEEQKRREARYKDIYLRNKTRKAIRDSERIKEMAAAKEIEARTVAEKDLRDDVAKIDDAIERSFRKFEYISPVINKRKFFPKTLTETERLKAIMHKENCVRKDLAKVEQEFFLERTGKVKKFPDAEQNLACEASIEGSVGSTPSEQSSDDEDYLKVGKIGDKFQLRGFHFKHGDGMRGKLHRHQIMEGQRTVKGCLTRDEWLNQLAPRKEPIKLDVERGIVKVLDPDDPKLDLFPPEPMLLHKREKKSAIKEYIDKRLGLHYHRVMHKNLKLVKPPLRFHVKKFNLIRYVFPEKIIVPDAPDLLEADMVDASKVETTLEYIALKGKVAKAKNLKKKLARMKLLGLTCVEAKQLREQSPCDVKEETLDMDWVPPQEPVKAPESISYDEVEEAEYHRMMGGSEHVPLEMRGNMPAPKFREKTLLIHPRRQRDYLAERRPTSTFIEGIRKSGMPLLEKIAPDNIKFANVRTIKRPYTAKFEARHHHDHWDPTQVKNVHVHYQTKTVYPKITVQEQPERVPIVNFINANPPCKQYMNTDLTMPRYDFDSMIANHLAATRTDSKDGAREIVQDLCHAHDFIFHSRDPQELTTLDFPGRRQYLDFLHETREALYETKDIEPGEEHLLVDRKAIVAELEEDLKSIEECLSSLSSSECTNLTKDSGSFLLLEDETKIPLDYIRKPLVPFEEMRRSRFQAEVINVDAEEENPYRMLPFSGQHKEQAAMLGPKDSFFTFNSRLRNGLRLRLEVPVPDVRKTLLGPGPTKYFGSVITDLDENYIDELKSRATVKNFNFKTGVELLKVAMRLKYESLLIQGKMVRTKIYDTLNERHWLDMKNTSLLYEGLFAKWEKKEYNAAMTQVYQVKTYYEITDKMKQEFRELERELTMLNMDIVFIEGHWIRCVMLQNFHYLLGEEEWRAENDWIHRVPVKKRGKFGAEEVEQPIEPIAPEDDEDVEYELEPYDQSIAKRTIVNIRVRDKDDAWAIRDFYYDVYMRNLHPVLQVFPNAEAFLQGVDNLKNKTFMLLLEMHYTLSIHTELQGRLETFVDWCNKDLKEKQEYVARKSVRKFFMEDRAIEMEARVRTYLEKPIENSFANEDFNKYRGFLAEVWRRIVPATVRGSSDVIPLASDMVATISTVVLELLSKFERLDIEKMRELEMSLRKRRRYLEKLSAQAYQIERRIDMEMKKVRRNLEPPFKKPKKVGPLQRLHLRKRVKKIIPPPVIISENTKNFVRAFAEDGVVSEGFNQDSVMVVDNMQEQIVPFYFDHFLKLNGYTPNYNFKTNIEMRDGPEINRFRIREIIPDVLQKVENWENMHRKIMEDNIQRNPKMYENVS
ncbi:GH10725 [Drosophila grimshawi]|uniref:GH10725 n=2 Tax=Drosophila grimshawi TaxID=7222 RepID=B4JBS9_DROGR|nr:GH10725 [Drosophila grimshawi]